MIVDEVALRGLIEDVVRKVLREELHSQSAEPMAYLSIAEAARRVEVTPATVRDWIGRGLLVRYQAGRELRVQSRELELLLRAGSGEEKRMPEPEEEARRFLQRRSGRKPSIG